MTEWAVRRWARYGHDRLYAETPGGTALGFLDLKTGRYHSDDITNLPLLEKAISEYFAGQQPIQDRAPAVPTVPSAPGPLPEAEPAVLPVAVVAEPPAPPPVDETLPSQSLAVGPVRAQAPAAAWEDLAATRVGAAARERALAEKEAQGRFRHTVARLIGAKTDERAWRIGADGEEAVAAQLAKLPPDWRVLHAIKVGERGSDIDHVVIGPAGVFTINAKHHPHTRVWVGGDTFIVNGRRTDYVRNSRHEAKRAARLLTEQAGFPVAVIGVIAVMGAHDGFAVKEQPRDGAVVVVQRKRITEHLLKLPPTLTFPAVEAIYNVARRSTTWRPPE